MAGSEAGAVAQAVAGEAGEFRALVESHSRSLFRLAYRMTGNEQDAEEVVQETFLRAYRGFDRFESRSQPGTWLHRIAVNCALDLLRARQRGAGHRSLEDVEHGEAATELAADDPGPDRLVFSSEIQRKIAGALARLTPTERAAFVLRHFEGSSIEQIGRELGISENATKNSIFRAVQKLRQSLEPLVCK